MINLNFELSLFQFVVGMIILLLLSVAAIVLVVSYGFSDKVT